MKAALCLCLIPAGIQIAVFLMTVQELGKTSDAIQSNLGASILCAPFVLAGVVCAIRTRLPRGKKIALVLVAAVCLAVVTWPILLLLLFFAYLGLGGPINPG